MGLFGKKRELPPLFTDDELVNFDSTVDFLVGLSDKDFEKIIKVAKIYRSANRAADKLLPFEKQPAITIDKESKPTDELDFIFDDEKPKKPKPKRIKVK